MLFRLDFIMETNIMDPYQTASRYECIFENEFSYFSTKTYVVGTQKGCLNETALEHPKKHV